MGTIHNISISVVVPVYNGAVSLSELTERITTVLLKLTDNFEIIFVNDGSQDNSWQIIQELAQKHSSVRGYKMMRNYGQHNALLCGIRCARNDIVVTMDDDLQHPPEEIPKLIDKLEEGFDVVYGSPQIVSHSLLRVIASKITRLALQSALGVETARKCSAFRAFRTYLRDAFHDYKSPFASIDVLLTWGTRNFAAVSVHHESRKVGQSNYSFMKLMNLAFTLMTGFSILPLQIASFVGFVFALFGVIILFFVIGRYLLLGYSVPGFPFLASIVSIFSGAQLLALGVIGEYLARMHYRMMEKPTYVVHEATDNLLHKDS